MFHRRRRRSPFGSSTTLNALRTGSGWTGKDLDDLRKADVEGASPHRNAGNGETVQKKLHSDAATTEETKWLQTAQKKINKKNALTKQKAKAALIVMQT
jgi:hypothetical protein